MTSLIFAVGIFFLGLICVSHLYAHRVDPVVEGKRMSIWALDLVRETYRRDEYRVKPEYTRIFKTDRDAAIPALMNAVDFHPSKARIVWFRVTQLLPKQLGAALRPQPTYTINRWAGLLALSHLAREKPDARIAPFFLHCMRDSNVAVRKVTAYEAGPWLDPERPDIAARVLALALSDQSPDVRRDACRRIVASGGKADRYGAALRELLPQLRAMPVALTPESSKALVILAN